MTDKKQTAGLEPQASPCKEDVCRIAACNDGGVTNYETEAEKFFVGLFQTMRQDYGESVRQMLKEHDGEEFDVEEERRMLHDMMLSTEILKLRELYAHDDHAFVHAALKLGDLVATFQLTITYEVRKKRIEACSRRESVSLCKASADNVRDRRFAYAARKVREEGLLKNDYDWAWIELYCEGQWGLELFSSPQSFLDYLKLVGVEDLPLRTSVSRKLSVVKGEYPSWTFTDTAKPREVQRRKLIVGRFIFHFNKFNG